MVLKSIYNLKYLIFLCLLIFLSYIYYIKYKVQRENYLTYKRCDEKKLQGYNEKYI